MKIGLIGVGRIGRILLKILLNNSKKKIVFINEVNSNSENTAYLLNYDNKHISKIKFTSSNNFLISNRSKIPFFSEKNLNKIDLKKYNLDILIDTSGSIENLNFFRKNKFNFKYLISNNGDFGKDIISIFKGLKLDKNIIKKNKIFSSNICDVVSFYPILNILKKKFDITNISLILLHPWLINQKLLSSHSVNSVLEDKINSHFALGRSAINNLIPKNTSVVEGLRIIPEFSNAFLKNIEAMVYRIPTSIVSAGIAHIQFKKTIDVKIAKQMFLKFEKKQKKSIIKNSFEPLVSEDFKDEESSVIIDQNWIKQIGNKCVKLHYWYDNEYGYSSSLVDNLEILAKLK